MKVIPAVDEAAADWVWGQIFDQPQHKFGPCTCFGLLNEITEDMAGAVIYHNFSYDLSETLISVEMSIATIDKRWATRQTLRDLFAYPFTHLKVGRVQTTCSALDEGAVSMNKRLGFKQEGYHRQAYPDGGDCYSWAMLKPECRWL